MKLHLFGLGFHASVSWRGHIEFEPDPSVKDDFGVGLQVGDRALFVAGITDAEGILA